MIPTNRTPTNKTSRSRRHRSAVACQACRQRKVRCSLTVTGIPCAVCIQDGSECIVDMKGGKVVEQLSRLTPASSRRISDRPVGTISPSNARIPSPMHAGDAVDFVPGNTASRSGTASRTRTPEYRRNIEEEEQTGLEIASAALGQPQRSGEVPFYTGEQTGPTSALDILSPGQSLPKHFLIPSHRKDLPAEDREFLSRKGCFTLPGKDACDSMIEAYFLHIHPILPVVEADLLLLHYQTGQLGSYNTLVLWSLFFAAVNFIPVSICEQEGYSSRREMSFDMFSRAKCMYNNGNERNSIMLLQSSLLLGFWYSDKEESAQPWYWTGIAVSLGQILGLHRDPGISSHNSSITDRQRSFWRRLWWCCFFRDRWLGLTLGRPLRINLGDCDIPMPSVNDMLFDIGNTQCASPSCLPGDMQKSAEYWIVLIELSCLLGKVMAMNYQAARSKPSFQEVEKLEQELLRSSLPDQYEVDLTPSNRFYSNHIHLHYQAILVTFYRPWGIDTPKQLNISTEKSWQQRMRLRADAAASRTNEILDALVQGSLLGFAGPMTPPLLVPAMQVHLFHCKTGDSLSKRVRLHKLEMCMLVMEEFQKTYTVASIYRAVFTKALQLIFPGYSAPVAPFSSDDHVEAATESVPSTSVSGTGNSLVVPAAHEYTGIDDGGFCVGEVDLMDALMDEASIFSFWEACNQI